jgi:hypothetical protein
MKKTFHVSASTRARSTPVVGDFGLRAGNGNIPGGGGKSVTKLSRETKNQLRLDRLSETSY